MPTLILTRCLFKWDNDDPFTEGYVVFTEECEPLTFYYWSVRSQCWLDYEAADIADWHLRH